ncbi:flagellar motor switch protein FliG [Thermovirga lienii DSM 17291]|jgi:flagellar motor switch protein FliG|uniref:Flagellar motor switch protein FliG n=1 Tax=Thermovirga lienii (strain ATCC BAA-1197 / DSM 17291 / Cas60314) TaxID=580340 RepID=G7V5J4_THELD|nr:flagellar motor switch protein FliG [Thermovirga lienii]AER65821.1 flagellar motor switch protein FliG [Thermovirga lienii DSM 17291]
MELRGRKKAAILLILLGPERAAQIYRHLDEASIEFLTLEIASVRKITSEERRAVLKEVQELVMAKEFLGKGGVSYARELLEQALGKEKAEDLLKRLTSSLQSKPFDFLRTSDPVQLFSFLQGEHPQTIALILAYLPPDKAAAIISGLPGELQADVAFRIAKMDSVSPEVLKEAEKVMERKFSAVVGADFSRAGGIDSIVAIINKAGRKTEKQILEILDEKDPEMAEEIRKKLFTFEDIVKIDDKSLQKVVRDVDTKDLAMALKGVSDDLREKFYRNMSSRAVEMLKEEMEYMGPVRLRDVEEAQQKIVNIIRKLEEAGEIVIAGSGEDIVT